jgi:hypothetical protein
MDNRVWITAFILAAARCGTTVVIGRVPKRRER